MNKSELIEIVKQVEDKRIVKINDEWYYHASVYNKEKYRDILTSGIKSRFCKNGFKFKSAGGWNGQFYISLMKRDIDGIYSFLESSWYSVLYGSPRFIIDETIKTFKTNYPIGNTPTLSNSFIPIRNSYYKDEWQAFYKILPSYILGVEYSISDLVNYYENCLVYFNVLLDLVRLLSELNIDIPIYDFSSMLEINKSRVLLLEK